MCKQKLNKSIQALATGGLLNINLYIIDYFDFRILHYNTVLMPVRCVTDKLVSKNKSNSEKQRLGSASLCLYETITKHEI
jgi:uncharacterized membrane protein